MLEVLHTMAEGQDSGHELPPIKLQEPRVQPLNPSHYGQSPKVVTISNDYFLKKAIDSRRKFGSDRNGNPTYGQEVVNVFLSKKQSLTRSSLLGWRGYVEEGIKWYAPLGSDFGLDLWKLHTMAVQVERPWKMMDKGLNFGLGLWRLHTMHGQRLHLLYF
jgi:hypothetical protein